MSRAPNQLVVVVVEAMEAALATKARREELEAGRWRSIEICFGGGGGGGECNASRWS